MRWGIPKRMPLRFLSYTKKIKNYINKGTRKMRIKYETENIRSFGRWKSSINEAIYRP